MHRFVAASLASSVVLAGAVASADKIVSDQHGITAVGAGVKEIGVESMFVLNSRSTAETKSGAKDDVSATSVSLLGGLVFRYFVADQFYLSVNGGALYRSTTTSVGGSQAGKVGSVGFLGTIGAGYLLKIGGGMFFVPAVGVGGYSLNTDSTTKVTVGTNTSDVTVSTGEAGLAVRVEAGFVFYSSPHFNLFARPQALIMNGTNKLKNPPAGVEQTSTKSTTIDGGFDVGVSYVF